MSTHKRWQPGTAALLALAITAATTAPFVASSSALAQYRTSPSQRLVDYRIPSGTVIPVTYEKEKIVVSPKETTDVTLTVAQDIVARDGSLLIPRGSEVFGQLQPVSGGSQFVARELRLPQSQPQSLNASSRVVTRTQEVRRGTNPTSIVAGAAVGSAAAAAISGLTGDRRIGALEVLAGTGVGAVGGLLLGRNSTTVVVIEPDRDLDLTLRSDLVVSRLGYNSGYGSGNTIDDDRGI